MGTIWVIVLELFVCTHCYDLDVVSFLEEGLG